MTAAIFPNLEVPIPCWHHPIMYRPCEWGHPQLFSFCFHFENLSENPFIGLPKAQDSWYFDHYFPHLVCLSFNGFAMYFLVH
jgi:hypothetical protein